MSALDARLKSFHAALPPDERELFEIILDNGLGQHRDAAESLARRLTRFASQLPRGQQREFRLMLNRAGRGLLPHASEPPRGSPEHAAVRATTECLAHFAPLNLIWRGRPAEMDDPLLRELQAEAKRRRRHAHRSNRVRLTSGGPAAGRLMRSRWLEALVKDVAGRWRPTRSASYLYYENAGDGICPHIDQPDYALNVLLSLDHVWQHEPRSRLVIYPPGEPPLRVLLEPGELLIFSAARFLHGREDLGRGEKLTLLSLGFTDRRAR